MRDLIGFYAKLIALRKSDARWFDGNRKIVDTEGDELVFRVSDYLVAVNPSDRTGVVDVPPRLWKAIQVTCIVTGAALSVRQRGWRQHRGR